MATTTNYGWETPDDTDLVKDGAAAIRTLGSSVDTTTKNLNPETTLGDIAYRSATSNTNTRLAIGSAGQVLTVAAGVPSWASPSDQTPLTTKGDVFTFSTVDARLGVGANNTVLTADSAETTGLKWAAPASGSLRFIQRSSFSDVANTSTTFDGVFTSTYKAYQVVVEKIHSASGAGAGEALQLQFIYSGTTQILTYNGGFGNGGATYFGQSSSDTSELKLTHQVGYDVNPNSYIMWFSYVGNASEKANVYGLGFGQNNNGGGFFAGGNATARTYTGFRFKAASGNITGTVAVYGIASS
jgi:hypothetical protein